MVRPKYIKSKRDDKGSLEVIFTAMGHVVYTDYNSYMYAIYNP